MPSIKGWRSFLLAFYIGSGKNTITRIVQPSVSALHLQLEFRIDIRSRMCENSFVMRSVHLLGRWRIKEQVLVQWSFVYLKSRSKNLTKCLNKGTFLLDFELELRFQSRFLVYHSKRTIWQLYNVLANALKLQPRFDARARVSGSVVYEI